MTKSFTLKQLANHLQTFGLDAECRGDENQMVSGIQSLLKASQREISFLSDDKYLAALPSSQAGAVLIKSEHAHLFSGNAILVANPYAAYALIAQKFYPHINEGGIHASAVIADSAELHPTAQIGANCVIGESVKIAQDVVISAGCVIESGVSIGKACRLAPNVTVMHHCQIGENCIIESGAVIGGDGFGWAKHKGQWIKIPQVGRVLIGNSVSIGNNTTIDRGALEDTVIGDNCIIDNQVHIAHNVVIGSGTAIAGQVGFAGSSKIGKNCTFAGQAGVVGHIEIGEGITLMGRGVATHSIQSPGAYAGFPAVPVAEWHKNTVYSKNLAKLSQKVKQLEKQLKPNENNNNT